MDTKNILLATLMTSTLAMAAQNGIVTHTELGFMDTSGNTQTQTFNLDSKIEKSVDKHQFALTLDAQYATNDSIEIKNKYIAESTYDYEISKMLSFGYLLGYKQDRFSGYDYQLYTGPTTKYKAILTQAHKLSLEVAILYTQDKIENLDDANSYAAYGAGLAYIWQIQKNLKFTQDINYRSEFSDTKNYFSGSKTALISKISDIFSVGISYKLDYVNLQAPGKVHTDKTLSANLIINY